MLCLRFLGGINCSRACCCRACTANPHVRNVPAAPTPPRFGKLIEVCVQHRIVDGVALEMANIVKRNGDRALHGGNTDVGDARDALIAARGLIERLQT